METQINGITGPQPGILVDTQILEAMDNGWLGIDPFDEDSLEPATYDLSVGKTCILSTWSNPINLEEQRTITIDPFSIAFLQSDEILRLGNKMVGRIGPKSSILRQGIFASTGPQLDPGFNGRLFVNLINFTDRPFLIEYKQPFLTVEFHGLSRAPSKLYSGQYQDKTELRPEEINAILGRGGPGFKEIHRDLLELINVTKTAQDWTKELPALRKNIEALRIKNEEVPFNVRITTLSPEPFDLLREIPATLKPVEGGFTATFFDANISASGDTSEEAIKNLKIFIVELFEDLESENEEKLGPEPKRQLSVLRELIRKRNSHAK